MFLPATTLPLLREGALYQLHVAADELRLAIETLGRRKDAARFINPVANFDRARALLDEIGWADGERDHDTEIDLNRHQAVVFAALTDQLRTERDVAEQNDGECRQEARVAIAAIEALMQTAELAGTTSD